MRQEPAPGFEILVNGVERTFRDVEVVVYDAAMMLKKRRPLDDVSIKDVATGAVVKVRTDGRRISRRVGGWRH